MTVPDNTAREAGDASPSRGARSLAELREQLVLIARRAYSLGFAPGTSGNVSVRVPGRPRVLIKAAGKSFADLTVRDTVVVDEDGRVADAASGARPSTECLFHCAIYRARPDVAAIAHLHPPHCVAFAAARALPPLLTDAGRTLFDRSLALVPAAPSGSPDLAALVGAAFRDRRIHAAILAEHGTVTVGPDLSAALHLSEHLEETARTAWLARQLPGSDSGTSR